MLLSGTFVANFGSELAADSPLWDLPNVIVSPHSASAASGNDKRAADIFAANLMKWVRGQPLLNERRA